MKIIDNINEEKNIKEFLKISLFNPEETILIKNINSVEKVYKLALLLMKKFIFNKNIYFEIKEDNIENLKEIIKICNNFKINIIIKTEKYEVYKNIFENLLKEDIEINIEPFNKIIQYLVFEDEKTINNSFFKNEEIFNIIKYLEKENVINEELKKEIKTIYEDHLNNQIIFKKMEKGLI